MKIVAVGTLKTFWTQYPTAEQPLKTWVNDVKKARWTSPMDIKAHIASASILKGCRVVFNIKGNDYRLVASVAYTKQIIYIKFIGTHQQYDNVDANTVEME
jgi:mRNA interferase HigB